MNGKSIAAVFVVSVVSVVLAIGITYIVASSANEVSLTLQTQDPNAKTSTPTLTEQPGIASIIIDGTVLPTSAYNCTFPLETWLQFPGAWRISNYRVGEQIYSRDDMLAVMGRPNGDLWDRLFGQVFTAVLNQQNGAEVTSISTTFSEAIAWLENFPRSSNPTDGEIQQGEITYAALRTFNEGQDGPPACQYDLSRSTTVARATLPPGVTPTTITTTPTAGRPRQYIEPTRTREPVQPKPTRKPTSVPRTQPPPTAVPPTAIPTTPIPTTPSVPTELPTPQPPTSVPTTAPTDTSVPPTVAATQPPQPTATQPAPTIGITIIPQPTATVNPPTNPPPAPTSTKTKKPRP